MVARTLPGGTFAMAEDLTVTRLGYGAMQLAGPGVLGPPKDRDAAVAVLREAVELGITHITRPTTTARMSPTRSSRRLCPLTRTTSALSPRSEPSATPRAAGRTPAHPRSCARLCSTT